MPLGKALLQSPSDKAQSYRICSKSVLSQVRPGGFSHPNDYFTRQSQEKACNRREQVKVGSRVNGFGNQTLISPGHAKAGVKHFVQIKKWLGTNCLFLQFTLV